MILEGATLDTILRWVVLGASTCLFYILFSLGLTLIFGFHEVLNFAHGGFYMLGAYIGLLFFTLTGNFGVAIIASVLCTMSIAALFERFFVSRLYGTDPANNFLLTFAFGLTFIGIVKLIAGVQFKYFARPELLAGAVTIGTVTIPHYRIFFIAISILLIILVHMLLTRTRIGIVIRAGIIDRSAVEVLGIKVKNYFTLLFAIGSGLAGIAGVLMAPLGTLFPAMGGELIIWAFVIVIIGGLGSFKGAIIGGVIIGLLHSFGTIALGPDILLVTFVILIVFMLLRPRGLFGARTM